MRKKTRRERRVHEFVAVERNQSQETLRRYKSRHRALTCEDCKKTVRLHTLKELAVCVAQTRAKAKRVAAVDKIFDVEQIDGVEYYTCRLCSLSVRAFDVLAHMERHIADEVKRQAETEAQVDKS
jgi:hypothetical protein